MARLFIDGFEHGTSPFYDAATFLWEDTSDFDLTSTYAMTGSYSAYLTNQAYMAKYVPENAVVVVNARLMIDYPFSVYPPKMKVKFSTHFGQLQGSAYFEIIPSTATVITNVYNGADSAVSTNVTTSLPDPVFCIQVRFTNTSGTDKRMELYINRQLKHDISFTNPSDDCGTTGKIGFHNEIVTGTGPSSVLIIDDVVIDDADLVDDPEIYALNPAADGTSSQWTPSSGESHYDKVVTPPVPYGAVLLPYIQTNTDGAIDLFSMSCPSLADANIRSLELLVYGEAGDQVVGDAYYGVIRTNGAIHWGNSGEYRPPMVQNQSRNLGFDGPAGSTTFTDDTGKIWTAHGNAHVDNTIFHLTDAASREPFFEGVGVFSGEGDYISTPADDDFSFSHSEPFCISSCFRRSFSSTSGELGLFSAGDTSGSAYIGVKVGKEAIRAYVKTSGEAPVELKSYREDLNLRDGEWYHVCVSHEVSPQNLYVLQLDGEWVATRSVDGHMLIDKPVSVGVFDGSYWVGEIDDFAFGVGYPTVLLPEDQEVGAYVCKVWDSNPETSGEWTVSEIENLECGVIFRSGHE